MPSKSSTFTPSSILFRPQHKHLISRSERVHKMFVVEAPGTAPGSEKLISMYVYRHSHLHDKTIISHHCAKVKHILLNICDQERLHD